MNKIRAHVFAAMLSACLAVFQVISYSEDVPDEALPSDGSVPAERSKDASWHNHRGFYLSMSTGPAFGDIVFDASGTIFNQMIFSGSGYTFDFKIGGAVVENIILSADMLSREIVGPDITMDGLSGTTNSNVSAGDAAFGVGLTYYIMPVNVFVNATLASCNFTMNFNGTEGSSETGFGFLAKIGKEWWVSRNWGLGISGSYGYSSAYDKPDPLVPEYSGKLSTSKFAVMFNTTFN